MKDLSYVAEECPFKTSEEDHKCQEMATTLRKLYDINNIANNYYISDNITKMNNIIYDYSLGEKEKQLAREVLNEFECVKRNNNASSISDYNHAFNNSRVSTLYHIFRENENKAKDEDAD